MRFATVLLVAGVFLMTASADEGMWLVNDPPRERLKSQYGFDLTDAWLENARLASVRFNNGGSGGFVSPDGLIITNHHIGEDSLKKLSTPQRNLLLTGFYAPGRADELKCPDLELNVLQSIEDVTAQVQQAVKSGASPAEAAAVRRAAMSKIEKDSLDKTGLRSDVVTLYQGGLYHLYRYKKYTDVRLVFAPEAAAAAFGGDVDNFEYPRFGFDVTFFRAYENGQPAKVQHWFRWATQSPSEGDLVFVTGHPGTTNRQETVAKLLYRRDRGHPYALARVRALEAALLQFSERGPTERAAAAHDLHSVANARKAISGQYQGLLDPKILDVKKGEEQALQAADPTTKSAWDGIAAAQDTLRRIDRTYSLFERGDAFTSELFTIARQIVRLAEETPKPSGERLREYRDSNLESLKFQLFSPAPIEAEAEKVKLAAALTFMAEQLGGEHPLVVKVLAGQPPHRRAAELVAGCTLFSPDKRRALVDGGADAVRSSTDPMIALARAIDPDAREVRKQFENEVEEVERQGYARISQVRFKKFGRGVAPDATFTLRLAFGRTLGYDLDGEKIPFHTTLAGLFARAEKLGYREPFDLPARWRDGKAKLNLTTPLNFVSTADTIGGNSGSPVLNRAGELVGINFDRNRHGLVRNFVYTDVQARHVAVHGAAVIEALRNLFDAGGLVDELLGSAR